MVGMVRPRHSPRSLYHRNKGEFSETELSGVEKNSPPAADDCERFDSPDSRSHSSFAKVDSESSSNGIILLTLFLLQPILSHEAPWRSADAE